MEYLRRSNRSRRRVREASVTEMLEAGILALGEIAKRWDLSGAEQSALLQVSDRTRLRWKRARPTEGERMLDRLQLVLLVYQRAVERAGSDAAAALLVRRVGGALNPVLPQQTILEALAAPSILEMSRHVQRLNAEVSTW